MPDQMAHLHLYVFVAVRNGLFAVTGGVRIAVTGLFGANLEFGDFQSILDSADYTESRGSLSLQLSF